MRAQVSRLGKQPRHAIHRNARIAHEPAVGRARAHRRNHRHIPVGSIDLASFDAQFRTNAFSTILVTQAVLPHVPARGGHIVNVSSSLVYRPRAGLAVYAASKAAVSALTHAFAVELGPRNITVNAVAPALTRTDMTAPIPDEVKARMRESTPMGRLAEPDDIADAIAFLASDDGRWITGRTLMTDGGFI